MAADPVEKALYEVREGWGRFVKENVGSDPDRGTRVTFESDTLGEPWQWTVTYEFGLYGQPLDNSYAFRVRDKKGDARGVSQYLAKKIRATLPKAEEEATI